MKIKDRMYYRLYFMKSPSEQGTPPSEMDWENPTIYETLEHWDMVCKSFPYDIMGAAKQLPNNDFPDEDGIEVYVPPVGGLPLKEQTVELEFVMCSEYARENMLKFRDFITGRDGSGVLLGIYDSYTGLSGVNVIYQSFKPDIYWRREGTKEVVTFKVEFLFTEPMEMNRVIHPANGDFNDDFNDDLLKEYVYN